MIAIGVWGVAFLRQGDSHSIGSSFLSEVRRYRVYLPAGYNPSVKYPIVYSLDGEKWRHGAIFAANGRMLARLGLASDVIIVAIDSEGHRTRDFSPVRGAEAFTNFLRRELIPAIEREYSASRTRIISGHSYGGLYSLYALAEHPGLFSHHFALTPSVFHSEQIIDRLDAHLKCGNARASLYLFSGLELREDYGNGVDRLEVILRNSTAPGLVWRDAYFALPHSLSMLAGQLGALTTLAN